MLGVPGRAGVCFEYGGYCCGHWLTGNGALLSDQGGIYTLPSYLSPGARDLIPRMLLVDPMKRVTVPEIRHHNWFLNRLPRYLAVPPPDTTQQAKRVRSLPFHLTKLSQV